MTGSLSDRAGDNAAFKRLATKRVNNAIKHIRLIGNLSNRSNYSYSDKQVRAIFAALKEATKDAEAMFLKKQPQRFELTP